MVSIVGVRFKRASKVYDFDSGGLELASGDMVIVEVEKGMGIGTVVARPREVDPATVQRQLKKVIRKADAVDMERHGFNTERENEAYNACKEKIAKYRLPMKLVRVEYLFDSSKAIFYFTSDTRVDFRELVKDLASHFHTRIEMRQIGVRDEAKLLGGLGPCGRELCCSGFLSDFSPVTIKMAKEQNLALNPVKISGICGRLMCCLSYEHGMYKDGAHPGHRGGKKDCSSCGKHGEQPRAGAASEAAPEKKERPARPAQRADAADENKRRQGPRSRGRGGRRPRRRDGRGGGGNTGGGGNNSGGSSGREGASK